MRSARPWKAALAVAASTLAMSACGGGGSSGDDASSGDPVSGGSVSIIQMSEPRILDPAAMQNSAATQGIVGNALFGTLLMDNADGTFDYGLAKGLETSDGGTTWRLTLRDGLTYSDGSPMDAADVAANWKRIKDPSLGSASLAAAEYLDTMRPEGQVLTFTLTEPIANYGNAIVFNTLNWIAKPEALEGDPAAFDKNPIGAGPFTLESWARGGKMVLKKNPAYFDKPKPYVDGLELTANGDEGQRLTTVQSSGADAYVTNDSARYKEGLANGLKGVKLDLNGGVSMGMNTRFAPFDDPRAREAVAKAVDLDAVNEAAYDGQGTVPRSFFTKDSPFYNGVPLTGYDKDAAQRLFDELDDEGKPVEFTILAFQSSQSRRVSEAFQAQLSAYDHVKVEVEVLDYPAAIAKSNNREFQLSPAGSLGFIDPEVNLYQNLHSSSKGNYTGISDPQLDAALEKGRRSSDIKERKAAYKVVSERLAALNPIIFNIAYLNAISFRPEVAGFREYGSSSIAVDGVWTTDG